MTVKDSDFVPQRLREWEVEHVFAYAGDGINGLLAAWGLTRGRLQQRVDARDVLFLDPTRDGEPSAVLRRVAIPAGSPPVHATAR